MRPQGEIKPDNRAGIWYMIRRVPSEFAEIDRRTLIRVSTNIAVRDDPRGIRAKNVVKQLSSELEAYWRGMRDGQSAEARLRYEAAQNAPGRLACPIAQWMSCPADLVTILSSAFPCFLIVMRWNPKPR